MEQPVRANTVFRVSSSSRVIVKKRRESKTHLHDRGRSQRTVSRNGSERRPQQYPPTEVQNRSRPDSKIEIRLALSLVLLDDNQRAYRPLLADFHGGLRVFYTQTKIR